VARPTSAGRPVASTNGSSEGQQDSSATLSETFDGTQTLADRDQTLSDTDQTLSDTDQKASDTDQTLSDSDQSSSDADQDAADVDQAASERDLSPGAARSVHDRTREVRNRSSRQRSRVARERVDTAGARDAIAHARDLAAAARDEAAARRDRELAARDASWASNGHAATGAEVVLRAAEYRRIAAADRVSALEARARAAADRDQAARDREQAAQDRQQAQAERDALLERLVIAETDQLTGARARLAGLADLDHEIDRARRTTGLLVVAYVDVVGLKSINDSQGHAAGDALLARAVHEIHDRLRSYDLIVRLGGDEFLCALSGVKVKSARERFRAIEAALASDPDPCKIKVGFAALSANDTAAALIKRADPKVPKETRAKRS
jgi:diguanylate cyclase (GGDEF)-like protein